MIVKIKKLDPRAVIPKYAKSGDAAMDLYAISQGEADSFGNMTYRTGLAMEIPSGHVGLIYPRSSVCKTPHLLRNHVGVIDSGYRGEVVLKFGWYETREIKTDVYDEGDRIYFGNNITLKAPVLFPKIEEPKTMVGGFVRDVSQFMTTFVLSPGGKAKVGKYVIKGGIADAL